MSAYYNYESFAKELQFDELMDDDGDGMDELVRDILAFARLNQKDRFTVFPIAVDTWHEIRVNFLVCDRYEVSIFKIILRDDFEFALDVAMQLALECSLFSDDSMVDVKPDGYTVCLR